jgi:hypothetical protein
MVSSKALPDAIKQHFSIKPFYVLHMMQTWQNNILHIDMLLVHIYEVKVLAIHLYEVEGIK